MHTASMDSIDTTAIENMRHTHEKFYEKLFKNKYESMAQSYSTGFGIKNPHPFITPVKPSIYTRNIKFSPQTYPKTSHHAFKEGNYYVKKPKKKGSP